jgi:hypothetical protein
MNFYADPRSTGDIDLLLDVDPSAFDARVRPLFAPPAYLPAVVFAPPDHLGQLTDEHGLRFDLIMRPGPWTAERFRRAVTFEDPEFGPVQVTAPEDLVLAKVESFVAIDYPQHWNDARNICRYQSIDWAYVGTWARALGIADSVDRLRREATT